MLGTAPFSSERSTGDSKPTSKGRILSWGLGTKASWVGSPDAQWHFQMLCLCFCPLAFWVKMSPRQSGLWETETWGNFVLNPLTLAEEGGGSHFSPTLKAAGLPGHLAVGHRASQHLWDTAPSITCGPEEPAGARPASAFQGQG